MKQASGEAEIPFEGRSQFDPGKKFLINEDQKCEVVLNFPLFLNPVTERFV